MKKIRNVWAAIITGIIFLPSGVSAQTGVEKVKTGLGDIGGIINVFTGSIVRSLATLFATAAMVAFFFGIVQFIWGSREGKPDVMTNGKKFMVWGLVALFVMFSVWGIITYVQQIFGVTQNTITIPTIQINSGTSNTSNNGSGLPDGTTYWRCNGAVYTTESAYRAACPDSDEGRAGNGVTSGATTAGPCDGIASEIQRDRCLANQGGSGNYCSGRSEGSICTLPSGGTGACQNNEDSGEMGCYAVAGGGNGGCDGGQVMGENGCYTPGRDN